MKILFLCSSLEPGRDGVGDYTRALASECTRLGHECRVGALNDRHLTMGTDSSGNQENEFASFDCFRLSSKTSWSTRMKQLREQCFEFKPDIASLQFVNYGFHDKGLCFLLPTKLRSLPIKKWHIMFHELWIGFSIISPWKEQFVGFLQSRIVKRMVKRLNPVFITTSNELYIQLLDRKGITATRLPLFGNFSTTVTDDEELEAFVHTHELDIKQRARWLVVGIFGSVEFHFDIDQALHGLNEEAKSQNKKLLLLHAGGISNPEAWRDARLDANPGIDIRLLGRCTSNEISKFLSILDVGLPSIQKQMLGKSGVAAAMYDHGVELRVLGDLPLPEFGPEINEDQPADKLFWTRAQVADEFVREVEARIHNTNNSPPMRINDD